MRLGWLSDIHLNFLSAWALGRFFDDLARRNVDAWLVGGDIGEANSLFGYLEAFDRLPVHTYFVLGNHDYYRGSIERIRVARALIDPGPNLTWLTDARCIELSADTALVGDDGWADGRIGNALTTPVELNDFRLIRELNGLARRALVCRLEALGDGAAERLRPKLAEAADRYKQVLVLTHAPPYKRACWHEGAISTPDWLPWFTCKAVGDAISEAARKHPDVKFLVLCGHTHSPGRYEVGSNVLVLTACADYGRPTVQGIVEVDDGFEVQGVG